MNNIYNFIRLNKKDSPEFIIFITEIDTPINNKNLYNLGNKLFKKLIEKKSINQNSIIIISFIKHFSKTIKNMIISENIGNKAQDINDTINQIIVDYLKINKNKKVLDHYLVLNTQENLLNIHHLKKNFNLKTLYKYYV